jgi:hypothetical protein
MALVDSQSSACQDAALVPGQAPAKTRVGGAAQGGISARSRRDTPCRQGCGPSFSLLHQIGQKEGVHNVHTLGFGSGRTVPDWAGFRRFSGEWRKFKGWNPVRVPPRAQCFRRSGVF